MGGASKGRVAKKQRPAKSQALRQQHQRHHYSQQQQQLLQTINTTNPSSSNVSIPSSHSMRRGHSRRSHHLQHQPPTTSSSTYSTHHHHHHHHHHQSYSYHVDRSAIEQMFNHFREADQKKIGPEGMQQLFEELNVNPLDITALIFAWKLNAKVPFEFSEQEFTKGCIALKADSLDKLRKVIPTLKDSLTSFEEFRNFYMYAFEYNKPPETRSLPIETARQLFPILLEGRFHHLDLWLQFLNDRKHAISKDTYTLLLDFAVNINDDMSNFDEENGAWPVLLDEFVEFAKPKLQQSRR